MISWFKSLLKVWRREFSLVFSDAGVMIFFFGLPTLYPIVYTLIYNPEVIKNLPIAVIDHSRTAESRKFVRMIDATDGLEVYQYVDDKPAAKRLMDSKEVFGVLEIPADYSKRLGRGEQANVTYYADMSLLLRYRTAAFALTDVQLALGEQLRTEAVDAAGMLIPSGVGGQSISADSVMLGDPTQGFASFIMPGVLVLILQQSMILGITMLAGGASERRRRNRGYDPLEIDAPATATIVGKTLCYILLYLPLTLYALYLVPAMFALPHVGNIWHEMVFIFPMLLASSVLGMCVGVFVKEREASMLVVVFTSVVFLFMSGLTWPRYAMPPFWKLVSDFIPATWGVEGFIRLNSNGATVAQESRPYLMLWGLTVIYFFVAWLLMRVRGSRNPLQVTQRS